MTSMLPHSPIKTLVEFVNYVESLFDKITDSWSDLLFREGHRVALSLAWIDLKQSTLQGIKGALSNPDSNVNEKLKDAGLAPGGTQLQLKLQMLNDAWKRFTKRGTVRLLKELLGWINKLLGSLAKAVPGGEALKEFKEVVEKAIA